VEEVRPAIADADGLALSVARAGEEELPPVVAFAALDAFEKAAVEETIGLDDERILALRP
jgi:hypothetical protein